MAGLKQPDFRRPRRGLTSGEVPRGQVYDAVIADVGEGQCWKLYGRS